MHGTIKHFASRRFWECYNALPAETRRLADENYQLLKSDPKHPSLHLKKIGRFWSVRVGLHYRALAVESEQNIVWFWIGPHSVYDRLLDKG